MRHLVLSIALCACWSSATSPSPPIRTDHAVEAGSAASAHITRCPGAPRKPGCHGRDECVCEPGPAPTGGCGIRPHEQRACKLDADCGAGNVGLAFAVNCELGTKCEPRCTVTSCAPDQRCRSDGRCAPQMCDDGWDCSAYGTCAIGTAGADLHGCVAFRCATDAHCPCAGFCINERCARTEGVCLVPRG